MPDAELGAELDAAGTDDAPRVVMLVANGVAGDSRVQKIAWSMAGAGWKVTLVGRAAGEELERYRLGSADVLLVPVPKVVSEYERARLKGGSGAARLRPAYREARAALAARDAAAQRRVRSSAAAGVRDWLAEHPGADRAAALTTSGPAGGAAKRAAGNALGLVDRNGGWRWLNPWFGDLECAIAPVVEELRPDLIHAHDFHMVGIGARLAATLSTPERPVRWIYDAHEYLAGIEIPTRGDARARLRRRMLVGVEREYIGRADAVVTVSDGIALKLQEDHRLGVKPHVVLNAPVVATPTTSAGSSRSGGGGGGRSGRGGRGSGSSDGSSSSSDVRNLRTDCGIADDVPLMLYSGGMSPRRGIATAVDALAELSDVHLVLIARTDDPDVPGWVRRAELSGVAKRLHVVPYVSVDEVVPYISTATIGLVPILHLPNHELSLITKYFEYLHAALPIVTSDVREMAATTRRLGVGEVFTADDATSLAAAVRKVLENPARYRAVYESADDPRPASSWSGQAQQLDALYRRVVGRGPDAPRPLGDLRLERV